MPVIWLPIRVYLEDTDAQGVVYNASYFRFMERARTDWLREQGIDHSTFDAEHGIAFVLASIAARFKASGRLDDMLQVSAEVSNLKGARAEFTQQVRRESVDGELLVEATATVACIDRTTGQPKRWPSNFAKELG